MLVEGLHICIKLKTVFATAFGTKKHIICLLVAWGKNCLLNINARKKLNVEIKRLFEEKFVRKGWFIKSRDTYLDLFAYVNLLTVTYC